MGVELENVPLALTVKVDAERLELRRISNANREFLRHHTHAGEIILCVSSLRELFRILKSRLTNRRFREVIFGLKRSQI